MKRILFAIFFIATGAAAQLQGSGAISFGDIQVELGIVEGTANQTLAGASTPIAGSLFFEATGTLNKAAPHSMSEFYGYNQVDDFVMSTTSYGSAGAACDDTDLGATKWHEGSGAYPEVGDKIWNESTSTTVFNGGGNWFRIPGEDQVIRINSLGVVLEKEDCNQTFSMSFPQTTFDNTAQSFDITITSNTTWNVSEIVSWISLDQTSGSGNDVITASLTLNSGAQRNANITGTYALGSQVTNIVQLATGYQTISLGYDASTEATACGATPTNLKADTTDLSTATLLLNFFTENPAIAGYYSDGVIVKYWNGSSFTSTNFCL